MNAPPLPSGALVAPESPKERAAGPPGPPHRGLAALAATSTFRFMAFYLLAFLVLGAMVVGYLFWQTNALVTRQIAETLAVEINSLREQYRLGGAALLASTIEARSAEGGSGLYLLVDGSGRRIAGNLAALPPELGAEDVGGFFTYSPPDTPTGRHVAVGVLVRVPGNHLLLVGRDAESQRAFAVTARRVAIAGIGAVALLGLLGGLLASRAILRRINAINETSRTIMAGDLSRRVPLTGSADELDRLSANLNLMLDRIEQLMAGLREVSDNIAHDLKTPLNRLRNRAEAALREAGGAEAYRSALERVIEEADGLIATFNALLSIARLEAGASGEGRTAVDLAEVARDAIELYEPLAEEAGIAIEASIADGVVVTGDRQLIGQAITNLIDNALKYGAGCEVAADGAVLSDGSEGRHGEGRETAPHHRLSRSAIEVRVTLRDGAGEVSVGDHGPGIPPEDRERVLKRFVRLEVSRSRPGSGLGLSLVAAVARLHGGAVRLEDNGPGLRAVLVLPAR
ncbi:MAG: HAMP domain-containing sensor histidine kinase [Hyphomicrobiaceae bacterium]